MAFKTDLSIGERAQDFAISVLKEEFPGIRQIKGDFADYDLIADNGYTIEVKFDKESRKTGNVAIEYLYKGRPSGIAKTKAREWLHIFYLDGWVYARAKTLDLKHYIKSNRKDLVETDGGDNHLSKLILINKEDFVNRFGFIGIPRQEPQPSF